MQQIPTKLSFCVKVLPDFVKISSPSSELVEGGGVTFQCVVAGGHPRPSLVWLLNDKRYNTVEYVSSNLCSIPLVTKST